MFYDDRPDLIELWTWPCLQPHAHGRARAYLLEASLPRGLMVIAELPLQGLLLLDPCTVPWHGALSSTPIRRTSIAPQVFVEINMQRFIRKSALQMRFIVH